MKSNYLGRIYLLSTLAVLFTLVLVARLFVVQVIRSEEYSKMADRQYTKPSSDVFARGSIFFKEKDGNLISAATLKTVFLVTVNPSMITSPEDIFLVVNKIIPLDKTDFLVKTSKKNDPYEIIAKTEDSGLVDKIRSLKISGVNIYKENVRFYPGERLASQVLGIVSRTKEEGDLYAGRYGLEKFYDNILRRDGEGLYVNFFAEIFSNITNGIHKTSGEILGGDIVLSIEPNVLSFLEKQLSELSEKWQPDYLGGIVIDPKTGRIIAASFLPNFDPGDFGKEKDISVFSNPMTEHVFEMGSIIKPLTMAAGLDAGVIKATTKYEDKGFVSLNGKRIENHDQKVMGYVDMQSVIDNSLNTGAVFVMQKLGRERFRNYMLSFGLGEKTGIDLPNETEGLIGNLDSRYDIDYATAAFGQGLATTPIGAVRALSSLANGGLIVKPKFVDQVNDRAGINYLKGAEIQRRVLKSGTAEEISRMLVHAFDNGLMGGMYKIKQYSVAAKTGTAQIPNRAGGGYSDKSLHSFFGYFPAYDARFLVLLYMVDPKNGARYSSDTLPQPFVNIARFLLNYYEIAPDR